MEGEKSQVSRPLSVFRPVIQLSFIQFLLLASQCQLETGVATSTLRQTEGSSGKDCQESFSKRRGPGCSKK